MSSHEFVDLKGWVAKAFDFTSAGNSDAGVYTDASLGPGLCQPPSEAMILSASFGPPSSTPIGANPVMSFQNRIDYRPGGLDRVLAGEERAIAGHSVTQKPLVGRFLFRLLFK